MTDKICQFYVRGQCNRSRCEFLHPRDAKVIIENREKDRRKQRHRDEERHRKRQSSYERSRDRYRSAEPRHRELEMYRARHHHHALRYRSRSRSRSRSRGYYNDRLPMSETPCKFFLASGCRFGASCKFKHLRRRSRSPPVSHHVRSSPRPRHRSLSPYGSRKRHRSRSPVCYVERERIDRVSVSREKCVVEPGGSDTKARSYESKSRAEDRARSPSAVSSASPSPPRSSVVHVKEHASKDQREQNPNREKKEDNSNNRAKASVTPAVTLKKDETVKVAPVAKSKEKPIDRVDVKAEESKTSLKGDQPSPRTSRSKSVSPEIQRARSRSWSEDSVGVPKPGTRCRKCGQKVMEKV